MWFLLFSLIAQFETFHHSPYKDRTQKTYGYGTKAREQMCITPAYAEVLAVTELNKHYRIVRALKGLNDNQTAALVSLSYNIGPNAFRQSKLYDLVEDGKMCSARNEFDRWVYQSGKKLKGLLARRQAEKALFSQGMAC